MKAVLIVLISMVCLPALAEEKTCAVKGMDCTGCVDTVKEKVCKDEFSVCDVKIKDKKAKMGELHVITKDATAKVDETALSEAIKDTTYKVENCKAGKADAKATKKKST